MNSKQLFKMMKDAERIELLCVTAYIVNLSQDVNEAVEALQLQLQLTTTRYTTFLAEIKKANPKTVKFLANAYNFASEALKNYLRSKR